MEGVFIELSNLFHIDYSFLLWIQTCLCSSTSISSGDSLDNFAQLFDLKEQHEIRSECRALADSLASEPNERLFLLSDLECIITHYIKSHLLPADPAAAFDAANGWPPVLRVLMRVAATDRRIAYRLFTAILHSYIPRCCFFRLIRIVHNAQCTMQTVHAGAAPTISVCSLSFVCFYFITIPSSVLSWTHSNLHRIFIFHLSCVCAWTRINSLFCISFCWYFLFGWFNLLVYSYP